MLTLEGRIREMVHRFKYGGRPQLAGPLIRLCPWLEGQLGPEPVIVPVPLHRSRRHQRGYNQAELLARELRKRMTLDAPEGELVRTVPTPPQVGRDRLRRFDNVRGAFSWRGARLEGDSILLVDDVATTGATLDACASALRAAGSGPVTGVSIARVNV